MREDLIGYLLSALEPHEMRQVEQALRADPELQEDLAMLRAKLEPLHRELASEGVFQSPGDLITRTMASLPTWEAAAEIALQTELPIMAMAPAREQPGGFRRRWWDVAAGSLAVAVLLMIMLPLLARSRFEVRKTACQENLRQLGIAITQFVNRSEHDSLPQLADHGPEAFAGIYAVRLVEDQLLSYPEWRWCPDGRDLPSAARGLESAVNRVVSLDELHLAGRTDINGLQRMQKTAGGNYAYSLGVVDNERYTAPRYEGRSTFAILGDAPIAGVSTAENLDSEKLRWSHGDGANLLFEDGAVRFVDLSSDSSMPDHPFMNHRGAIEAGVNVDDASLAPSWRGPFINSRQR